MYPNVIKKVKGNQKMNDFALTSQLFFSFFILKHFEHIA